MKNLSRKDFIRELSHKTNYTQEELNNFLDAVIEVFEEAVEKENTISINGFLKLQYQKVKSRIGYNPKEKKAVEYPECTRVIFRVATTLKNIQRKKKE